MATTQEKWQEIANRGLQDNFDPQTRAKFDEAVNRGLITMPQQESAQPSPSIGEQIAGGIESAGVMASGIIAEPIAGIAGLGSMINPLEERNPGQVVEDVRERLTIQPQADTLGGAASQQQLQSVGEFVQPAVDVLESAESGLGDAVLAKTGSPELAAIAHTLPTAALEALGIAAFKPVAKLPAKTNQVAAVEEAIGLLPQRKTPFTAKGKRTQDLISQIEAKDASITTLGKGLETRPAPTTLTGQFSEKLRVAGPDIVDRPLETKVVNQGYDKGIVADIKDATPKTKSRMSQMLSLKKRGLDQARFGATNRPSDIVGEALMERVNVIISANEAAGNSIGNIAKKTLRGTDIDIADASGNFADSLDEFGISIIDDGKRGFRADYQNSILPKGDRGAINEVIRVMNIKGKSGIDAETVHDMKKILDNHISYGKTKDGLSADAERILRGYRGGLDEALDSKFPEYDAANKAYAETIDAINAFQDVAGSKLDLTSPTARKAAGQEMRKVLSNYGSRQRLVNAVDQLEETASKYKGFGTSIDGRLLIEDAGSSSSKFTDNLLSLTLFDNELDARFVPSARAGFENLVSRKVTRAAQAASSPTGVADLGVQAVGKGIEKVKGVTDETAIKAMFDLLESTD